MPGAFPVSLTPLMGFLFLAPLETERASYSLTAQPEPKANGRLSAGVGAGSAWVPEGTSFPQLLLVSLALGDMSPHGGNQVMLPTA